MPTDAWRRSAGLLPLMALGSLGADYPMPNQHVIWGLSFNAVGPDLAGISTSAPASSTYPTANTAFAYSFVIAHPFLVRKVFWFNGTTATTNSADVGVYDDQFVLKVSGGGTAITGASGLQEVDVTDTLLKPGRYYCAYAQNGTTATPVAIASSLINVRLLTLSATSSYPLPSDISPQSSAPTSTAFVCYGISSRTLVA